MVDAAGQGVQGVRGTHFSSGCNIYPVSSARHDYSGFDNDEYRCCCCCCSCCSRHQSCRTAYSHVSIHAIRRIPDQFVGVPSAVVLVPASFYEEPATDMDVCEKSEIDVDTLYLLQSLIRYGLLLERSFASFEPIKIVDGY